MGAQQPAAEAGRRAQRRCEPNEPPRAASEAACSARPTLSASCAHECAASECAPELSLHFVVMEDASSTTIKVWALCAVASVALPVALTSWKSVSSDPTSMFVAAVVLLGALAATAWYGVRAGAWRLLRARERCVWGGGGSSRKLEMQGRQTLLVFESPLRAPRLRRVRPV